MLKLLIIGAFFIAASSSVFAGTFYAVPSITYQNFYNDDGLRYQGVTARLYAGYGELFNQWIYFAGEIFANPKSIRIHNEKTGDISLETKYSYGASLVPGFLMDSMTKVFIRLGVIYTSFDNLDTCARGYQAGAGLDFELSPCWLIRAEYDYNKYDSISNISSIRTNEGSLGLIYMPDYFF